MALPVTKKLIERAKGGEKLSHQERRQCIAVLMVNEPGLSNGDLADIFHVSERMIRFDKKFIKEAFAKELKGLDPGIIIGEIMMMRDMAIANIEKSRDKCAAGSRTYLDHCIAPVKIMVETTKALQDIGFLPKELGNIQIDNYYYQATVHKDGTVETRRLDMFDKSPEKLKQLGDGKEREALDAEYLDLPAQSPTAPELVNATPQEGPNKPDDIASSDGASAAPHEGSKD